MRLLIDASGVTREKAGVGVYAKNLINTLVDYPDLHLFLVAQSDDPDFDYSLRQNVTMLWVPSRFLRKRPLRLIFEQTVLPLLLRKHRIEVAHSLHYSFPLVSFGAKTVITIHDMTFFSMPEVHLQSKKRYYRFYIRAAAKRADALIFVSHSAERDFVKRFGTPRSVSRVVHHGRDSRFFPNRDEAQLTDVRARYLLPTRFILYIGMIEPRKNLVRLVQAFAEIAGTYPEVALVIAGMKGWMYEDLFAEVKRLNLETRVAFPGFVPEADKALLLCAAEVFAYVSLYEGFGLPVLEALSCAVPTVTSNTSSLPEVAGDAALLVDPLNVAQIARALERLLSEPVLREQLKEASLAQAARFTWQRTADSTLQTYRDVLASSHSSTAPGH